MDLIKNYLDAVRSCLTILDSEDVIEELAENIRCHQEDREAELGRPLNDSEIEAMLHEMGHPLVVAARYRGEVDSLAFGKQLIGPALFPIYTRVLAINASLTAAICLIVSFALSRPLASAFPGIFFPVLLQFGIVTGIFIAAEMYLPRLTQSWNPREPFQAQSTVSTADERDPNRVSRSETVSHLVALAIMLYWLVAAKSAFMGQTDSPVRFGPAWAHIYWPSVLLIGAGIGHALVTLVRPDWTRFRIETRLALSTLGLCVMGYLLLAGNWVILADVSNSLASQHQPKIDFLNRWVVFPMLAVTTLVLALQPARDLLRLKGRESRVLSWFTAS